MITHDQVLRSKLDDLKNKGNLRVVRLDHSYTPDALIIDWEKKKVMALEVETLTRGYKPYLNGRVEGFKDNRVGFDETVVLIPKFPMSGFTKWTAEKYDEVVRLREHGLSYRKIGGRLGVAGNTVLRWLKLNGKLRIQQLMKRLEENNIRLEIYGGEYE